MQCEPSRTQRTRTKHGRTLWSTTVQRALVSHYHIEFAAESDIATPSPLSNYGRQRWKLPTNRTKKKLDVWPRRGRIARELLIRSRIDFPSRNVVDFSRWESYKKNNWPSFRRTLAGTIASTLVVSAGVYLKDTVLTMCYAKHGVLEVFSWAYNLWKLVERRTALTSMENQAPQQVSYDWCI